jgi:hypothetical protein
MRSVSHKTPLDLIDAVKESRLEGLRALRDVLAAEIRDGPSVPDGNRPVASQTPALAGQLRAVLGEIDVLEKSSRKGSSVDEIAQRRSARRADAAGDVPASVDRVKRRGGSDRAGG